MREVRQGKRRCDIGQSILDLRGPKKNAGVVLLEKARCGREGFDAKLRNLLVTLGIQKKKCARRFIRQGRGAVGKAAIRNCAIYFGPAGSKKSARVVQKG